MSHISVIFRTDASLQIGSGHVIRCLTLADELRQRGAKVMFICREHPGNLIGLIEGKGYQVARLPHPEAAYDAAADDVRHAAWLGVPWAQDAADTSAAMGNMLPQWLIVDHYAIDCRWEEKLRLLAGRIMVIDDLADRPHDCDLLLDQNLYQEMGNRYEILVPPGCHKLLGPGYALLRPEFAAVRTNLRQRDGQVRRVLVFFGGVDATNETEKAIKVLTGIVDRQFAVDVVVGGGNLYKEQIQKLCAGLHGFHYHCQVENMAAIMAAADLAIGAGGTATWERCAMGLPSIVTALADNQRKLARAGARNGLLFYLGEAGSDSLEHLLPVLISCTSAPETMLYYSATCLKTVDARGVNRVANLLFPPQIAVRRATLEDCDAVYEWRNAEETRRYIFHADTIPLDTHREWYRRTLENADRILLIGEIDNKPVGVLRYDLTQHTALISVYLVPGCQGQGAGAQIVRRGSQWLREHCPQISVVNAEISPENSASLRAFESARFKEHHLIFQEVL
ncbi:MAG: UDP-2,4-diacetamido-2,4,6-trideoxy-beta-L-altropyranose hydrolase [Desulfuromonadales bacterium]|nr:UDP-2,4-diacetamido-2,4,6-trideoxy-beta-L-altropyranose hydrolase [Desulfuromonadales bacterium]